MAISVAAGSSIAVVRGEERVLLSAVGMRQVMVALAPTVEQETGHRLAVTFDSGTVIRRRVQAGEDVDSVIIPRPAIGDLVRAGAVETPVLDVAKATVGLQAPFGIQVALGPNGNGRVSWMSRLAQWPFAASARP